MRNIILKGEIKMKEMNKEIMENGAVEIVEEVAEKLTFKENCLAYGLAGIFGIGVVTTGYLAFKGGKKLYNTIKDKRKLSEESDDESIVDVEDDEIHEVENNETEEN